MTKITHARSNENGEITNGRLGDNNGMEICTTDFYVHNKGWVILRPKDAIKAETIAEGAVLVANNDAFGYDQDYRDTGIQESKKVNYAVERVTTPCALDCSSMVRLCCLRAGINVNDFNTGNEKDVLVATGQFSAIDFTSEDQLCLGDILVTKTKGHTAIVTSVDVIEGWVQVGSVWYYYEDGKVVTRAWIKCNGYWYRVGNDGAMLTGYHQVYDKDGNLRECFFGETGELYHEADDRQGYLEPWLDI